MYGLPLTGVAVGWLVIGGVTLITAGTALIRLTRSRIKR